MDYQDTLTYLYNSVPMFQQVGGSAYKEGLENTLTLDAHFEHPHRSFRSIHVAGTNGKGSCSHTLAAILQEAGYRVGLYTSPHLVDFRERIRINGQPIPEEYVIRFVEQERGFFEPLHPSFFELTTAMAFRYFADEKVDVAVIEVGLGGRLDCTNIIRPDVWRFAVAHGGDDGRDGMAADARKRFLQALGEIQIVDRRMLIHKTSS